MTTLCFPPLRGLLLIAAATLCAVPARADSTSTAASDSGRRSITLPPIDVGGFAQIDERHAFNGSIRQEFAVRRATLFVAGRAVPRVSYRVELYGQTGSTVTLYEAFVHVDLGHGFAVRAGQNRYEFDIEGSQPEELLPVIDRSWASNMIAGSMNGGGAGFSYFNSFHDRGITLFSEGSAGAIDWSIVGGVYEGENGIGYDDHVGYTVRGRAHFGPVALSYGWMSNPTDYEDYYAWTAGLEHAWGRNQLRAEVYEGQSDYGSTDHEKQGGYVLDVFRVHPAVDVHVRWQTLWQEQSFVAWGDHASGVDAGARFYFSRGGQRTNTHVGFDWMMRKAGEGLTFDLGQLNDSVRRARFQSSDEWRHLVIARFQVAI